MSVFAGLIAEAPAGRGSPPDHVVWSMSGGMRQSSAGIAVTGDVALSAGSVFACVRNLAEDIAKMPKILYRRLEPEGKERATREPLYGLLHDRPNPETTSFDFHTAVIGQAVLRGNGYAEIERDGSGRPLAMWQLDTKRVKPKRDESKRLYYEVRDDAGQAYRVVMEDMIHVKGFTQDGIVGCMIASLGAETIGLSLAVERFAGTFFGNGATAGMVLMHPGKLTETARKNLQGSFDEQTKGAKAHGTIVLEEGTKAIQNTVNPEESQFIETRQFSVEDVARWFRMPPHKIGHLLRAAGWSTLEASNTDYIVDTLMSWAVRLEQEYKAKLFPLRQDLFVELLFDAMLRGDTLARAQANEIKIRNGALSPDEWRAMDNQNPLPNGQGKGYYISQNVQPIGKADQQTEPPLRSRQAEDEDEVDPDDEMARIHRASMRVFCDAFARATRREANAVMRAHDKHKDAAAMVASLHEFYVGHEAYMIETLLPPAEALEDLLCPAGVPDGLAGQVRLSIAVHAKCHTAESLRAIEAAKAGTLPAVVEEWGTARGPEAASRLVGLIVALCKQSRGERR